MNKITPHKSDGPSFENAGVHDAKNNLQVSTGWKEKLDAS
jgi:hypothetical protein